MTTVASELTRLRTSKRGMVQRTFHTQRAILQNLRARHLASNLPFHYDEEYDGTWGKYTRLERVFEGVFNTRSGETQSYLLWTCQVVKSFFSEVEEEKKLRGKSCAKFGKLRVFLTTRGEGRVMMGVQISYCFV